MVLTPHSGNTPPQIPLPQFDIPQYFKHAGSVRQLKQNIYDEAQYPESGSIFREAFLNFANDHQMLFNNSSLLMEIECEVKHIDQRESTEYFVENPTTNKLIFGTINFFKQTTTLMTGWNPHNFEEIMLRHPETLAAYFAKQGPEFPLGKDFANFLNFAEAEFIDTNFAIEFLSNLITEENRIYFLEAVSHPDRKGIIHDQILEGILERRPDLRPADRHPSRNVLFSLVGKYLNPKDLSELKVLNKSTRDSTAFAHMLLDQINEEHVPLGNLGLSKKRLHDFLQNHGAAITYFDASGYEQKFALELMKICPNARQIKLQRCQINSDWMMAFIRYMKDMKHLQTLDVANNQIGNDGIKELPELSKLHALDISDNKLTAPGAAHIGRMPNLQSLNISSNVISNEGIVSLCNLGNLHTLDISRCWFDNAGTKFISRLKNLHTLNMNYVTLLEDSLADIATLPNLQNLYVCHTSLGPAHARHIGTIKTLLTLDISSNNINAEGMSHIGNLDNLRSLEASVNSIRDRGAAYLWQLHQLQNLNINFNHIGSEGVKNIHLLEKLRTLSIDWNKIDDVAMESISKLPQLRNLSIFKNFLTDIGAKHISTMPYLQFLDVHWNDIGLKGMEDISQMSKLQTVVLSEFEATDDVRKLFEKHASLRIIHQKA